jgi:hypothetical protein
MLFMIVMEALSKLLDKAIVGNFLTGFSVGGGPSASISVSHLLFADDTLIFYDADPSQLLFFRLVLTWFEAIYGLRINLGKSELVSVGDVADIEELAGLLGCKTSALPMKYLGLPLGAHFKSKGIWDPIIEKMERRLVGWKRMYLSKDGRLTLIKSTLSNFPIYFLSLFPIPVSVAKCIEKIQRDFLWKGLGEDFKFHLVKWDTICSPISNGGLAVRNLKLFNEALLGKWLWRYGLEREALWRRVVDGKYSSLENGWSTAVSHGPHGVSLWKNIRGGWAKFERIIYFKVGNGAQIRFWYDTWCGDYPLKDIFPDLYCIACDKEAFVAAHLQLRNNSIHWEVNFTRATQDWESESISTFFDLLYSTKELGRGEDKMCWRIGSTTNFEVRLYYQALVPSIGSFHWKSIWQAKIPPRVAFFSWLASLGKFLTADNLRRRNFILVSWCCMCKADGESVDHLFLHCALARELWNMAFSLFGMYWVMPRRIVDDFASWKGRLGRHKNRHIWEAVPHCVM